MVILPLLLLPLLEAVVVVPTIQQPLDLLLMAAMVVQAAAVVTRLLALLVDQVTRLLYLPLKVTTVAADRSQRLTMEAAAVAEPVL